MFIHMGSLRGGSLSMDVISSRLVITLSTLRRTHMSRRSVTNLNSLQLKTLTDWRSGDWLISLNPSERSSGCRCPHSQKTESPATPQFWMSQDHLRTIKEQSKRPAGAHT